MLVSSCTVDRMFFRMFLNGNRREVCVLRWVFLWDFGVFLFDFVGVVFLLGFGFLGWVFFSPISP